MSGKSNQKDLSGLTFDTRSKIVMTSMPHRSQAMVKEKLAAVRAVVPNKSNHEITLVLEHFDYNVSDAINAFVEDGAAAKILKEWNINGSKAVKGAKRNPGEKAVTNQANKNGSSGGTGKNANLKSEKSEIANNSKKKEIGQTDTESSIKVNVAKNALGTTAVISTADGGKLPNDHDTATSGRFSQRNPDTRQSSISEGTGGQKGKKVSAEKSTKDLSRHAIMLHRYGNMLEDEVEKSIKRLRQAFKELRIVLDTRENDLVTQLENAKIEGRNLLDMRQKIADELKLGSQGAETMSESELNDLRLDIKQFVADRRLDEDIGRSLRLVRDHDRIIKEINAYGEVKPVKDEYIKRKRSVDSVITSQPIAPSVAAVQEKIPTGPCLGATVTLAPAAPAPSSAPGTLSTSELAELQQRLYESLKMQGLPLNNTSRSAPKDRYFAPRNVKENWKGSGSRYNGPGNGKDQEEQKGTEQMRQNATRGGRPSRGRQFEFQGGPRRRFEGGKPAYVESNVNSYEEKNKL